MTKIAINGFGRIGRNTFKILLDKSEVHIVGLNDLSSTTVLANELKYDSIYGVYHKNIRATEHSLFIDDKEIPVFAEKDPSKLPWKNLDVDIVLECTGRFTSGEKAKAHLDAGAKKVIISAPAKDEGITPTYLIGVNAEEYKGEKIISCASCTTNCITPISKILQKRLGIEKMMMTTVHSYTAEQSIVDTSPPGEHANDLRRARSGSTNIIPTSTGAAISTTQVIPELKGKFDGLSLRVPTPIVSISDFTILLSQPTTREKLNSILKEECDKNPAILGYTTDPVVSSDLKGDPRSAIIDLSLTNVVDGNLAKIVAWYDNEFGYSNRLAELALVISK